MDSIGANRAHWNRISASYQADHDAQIGARPRLWGAFSIDDAELGALADVAGLRVLEVGCGAGQWCWSLTAEAECVVGLDLSEIQLAVARRSLPAAGCGLIQGAAERLPFADSSFDVVLSDHGGLSWAPPELAVAEAARVLRAGGCLLFNVFSPLAQACYDSSADTVTSRLSGDYFGLGPVAQGGGAASYQLTYGDWIRVLRGSGLAIDDLIEPRPEPGRSSGYYNFSPPDWARRWPCEALWIARKP